MIERVRVTGCVVAMAVAVSAPAAAKPPIVTVGEAVPFSSATLADAVALRAGDAALTIRVSREGEALKVDVGGASQVVAVDLADPEAAVRVVAMVAVALGTAPPAPAPSGQNAATPAVAALAPPPAPTPTVSHLAVRGMVARRLDDTAAFTAAVAYRLAPPWRLAASVTTQAYRNDVPARYTIVRLGLEALHVEPFGIDGGLLVVPDEFGVVPGAYVDARFYYRPFGAHFRMVAGVGVQWILNADPVEDEAFSANLQGGLEWRL